MAIISKKAREFKRMSQHEVAEFLGVSQKILSNMESGKTQPSVVQLAMLGDIYGVDMLKLLSDNGIHLSTPETYLKQKKNYNS
ncbi:helix-turn-helix domain-containing protein [Algoriphagus sp.]|uniref:helix-turn-helix domain-containing protein n=1 Tax=Algoriphagus sp. TaxID=1872435 RepID=UPI003918C02B